jgi:hypothetical protein
LNNPSWHETWQIQLYREEAKSWLFHILSDFSIFWREESLEKTHKAYILDRRLILYLMTYEII